DTIYTIPITANSLGLSGVVRCACSFNINIQGGNSPTVRVRFGGVSVMNIFFSTTGQIFDSFTVGNRGAANSQITCNLFSQTGVLPVITNTASAVDTTLTQNLTITIQ